jgi:hypothetical protein
LESAPRAQAPHVLWHHLALSPCPCCPATAACCTAQVLDNERKLMAAAGHTDWVVNKRRFFTQFEAPGDTPLPELKSQTPF